MKYFYRNIISAAVSCLFLLFACLNAGARTDVGVRTAVLENGATILSRYVPGSPLVTIRIRVLSGLSNEGEYAGSGISHFLEHLIFKGAPDMTSRQVHDAIKEMGGVINATTGLDSAEYFITVPNANFEKAFSLLADMVMTPKFTDGEMEKERNVILKEIRMHNDDPGSRRLRLLFSSAYRDNVYKYPVIGYEDVFRDLTREDVLRYHARAYTPDRIVIGIVGGVRQDTAIARVREGFSRYGRGMPWQTDVAAEPAQLAAGRYEFPADVTTGYLAIGFHMTSLYSPELYAGDVLSVILGGGKGSRLYRRLVEEKELLHSVAAGNYTPKYPGLFVITGRGDPDRMEDAVKEIFSVIEELKAGRIEEDELVRARNLIVSGYLHAEERIESLGAHMTSAQLFTGDPAFYKKYVERTGKVESGAVRDAARRYLIMDNATTVILIPEGLYREQAPAAETQPGKKDEKAVTLENGMRVIVKKRGDLPLAAVTLAVPGGLAAESRQDNGISNLVASVMLKGTETRPAPDIVPVVEEAGGQIEAFSGMNSIGVSMDVQTAGLAGGLDIFRDVVMNAVFPAEELDKEREKVLAAIGEREKDLFDNGMFHLRRLLYAGQPYGMRVLGDKDSVSGMTREELRAFYGAKLVPGKVVLSIVGAVDPEETLREISGRFSEWSGAEGDRPARAVIPLKRRVEEDIRMKKEQALILVGFPGARLDEDARYTLDLISSLLSGSNGILFHVLREKEGIAYSSGASNVPQPEGGYFLLYAATTEENLEKAEKTIFGALRAVIAGDVSDEDIRASKNRLFTQHARSLETNASLAATVALDELYGLGTGNYKLYPGRIAALTRRDIEECARRVFDPGRCAIVRVHSDK